MPPLMRLLTLAILALGARALAQGPGSITSTRTQAHLRIDGRLDDAAWASAVPFSGFVESFPAAGQAPDLKTEVRVLHDDTFLYVGVHCFDPHPELIVRNLGRRDSTPFADLVEIAIDSNGDRRTAYDFSVNAAGVLRDQLLFADFNSTDTWDAVWNGAASLTSDGWSVEVEIPLRSLRFASDGRRWGFLVRRTVPRTHQIFDSALVPREANANNPGAPVVSRFGALEGLADVKPSRSLELLGYAAPKLGVRPQFSDPATPTPRLLDPSIDLGLDFKFALTSTLQVTGTINPDFGQVEADQVIQNLSTVEAQFPEKRPFFQQGLDLFQPVGAEYGSPQQLFYSRRIGLTTPILAAIKLTGSLTSTLDVGLLDAVVLGAGDPSTKALAFTNPDQAAIAAAEQSPDRRFEYHPQTPLHFGLNDQLPLARPVPTNFLAAVARQRFDETSSVGAIFTAATPLASRCVRADFATDAEYAAARCASGGVNALALDWNLRTHDGVWGFFGQAEGTQQVWGDPTGTTLVDGVVMKPGDLGFAGNLRVGKLGGAPFRFDLVYVYEGTKVNLNGLGFEAKTNIQWSDLNLHYVRPNGVGPFRAMNIDLNIDPNWTTDGRWLSRGLNLNFNAQVQLPSYDFVGVQCSYSGAKYDPREIQYSGVPFQRQPLLQPTVFVTTDANRKLYLNADVYGSQLFGVGASPGAFGWGFDFTGIWHPVDALETRLDGSYGHLPVGARWVETVETDAVFGWQNPEFLSLTLRQQVVVTPTLTVQVYAQLFSGHVTYDRYFQSSLDGRRELPTDALVASGYSGSPNSHGSTLNLNAVLRWEYRLGSTLFLVYTRSQSERATDTGVPVSTSLWPHQLFSGPASDTFLLKWTYWLSV